MKILDRMVIKEFIPNFIISLSILVFVLILNRVFELADLFIGKGVPLYIVLDIFINTLPFIIFLTIPMAVLVASIITFGRLSGDFEFAAMKSSGINIFRYVMVMFLFASVLFIIAYSFADFIVPDSNHRVRMLLSKVARMKPSVNIEEGIISETYDGEKEFYFETIEKNGTFTNGRIYEKNRYISAQSGMIADAGNNVDNIVHMRNGSIFENSDKGKFSLINYDKMEMRLSLAEDVNREVSISRGDREMTTMMLLANIEAAKMSFKDTGEYSKNRLKKTIYSNLVEIHKKFTIAFGVFGFIILGSVIGLFLRRSGLGIGFGVSTVLFVIYYIMLVVGEQLSDRGAVHPVITMWLPNVLTIIISAVLIYINIFRAPIQWPSFFRRRGR